MVDINNNITCIKCNGPVWKFGKDPDTGLQKYRCKNPSCHHQFVYGKPQRQKKYPDITCGFRLEI